MTDTDILIDGEKIDKIKPILENLVFVGALVAICALIINILVCTTLNDKKQAISYIKLKLSKSREI